MDREEKGSSLKRLQIILVVAVIVGCLYLGFIFPHI